MDLTLPIKDSKNPPYFQYLRQTHGAKKFFFERKCRKFNRTHDKSGQDKLTDPAVGYQVDYSRYRGGSYFQEEKVAFGAVCFNLCQSSNKFNISGGI